MTYSKYSNLIMNNLLWIHLHLFKRIRIIVNTTSDENNVSKRRMPITEGYSSETVTLQTVRIKPV